MSANDSVLELDRAPPPVRRRADDRVFLDSPSLIVRTVLFIDLVESARILEDDESALLRRWRQLSTTIEREILPAFHGRLVKSLGDGLMRGDTSPPISVGSAISWSPPGSPVLALVVYMKTPTALGNDRNMVRICLRPTATDDPVAKTAPSGIWTIDVTNVGDPITLDAWIQRDDTPFGYAIRGRQSRFVDSDYEYRDSVTGRLEEDPNGSAVRREGTINGIATGYNTIVMGGFRKSDWSAASTSASGPICRPATSAPRTRVGPDAMMISEHSAALPSVRAAGTRSGSVVALTGSSVAAPQMTRLIAGWMADGKASNWKAVQAYALTEEQKVPPNAPKIPAGRKGSGRISTRQRRDHA